MYDEDQDVDDLDRLLVCPYDEKHSVAATRMNHHLVKCRKNYFVNESEKTKCPFNAEHGIFAQEIEIHKMVCPDRPDFGSEDVEESEEKRPVDKNESVDVDEAEEAKPHMNGKSDPRTDETGCINGFKVGGLKNYNAVSNDEEATVMALENGETVENGEKEETHENGANGEEKCDFEDRSVNAVSHMAGIEPQDDNIAIEKQLSQSNGNIPSLENGILNENNMNGCIQEHFDYKKYAPSKEEKEEFLKLIKQRKDEQNNVEDKDESFNQTYVTQNWQQNYPYITPPYQTNQPYQGPGMYNTYIAFPTNGYHQVMNGNMNGQSPYPTHYTFPTPNGPAPQYMPQPMQGPGYEYNMYSPRPQYRPPYRRRNYHHNNHSHNNRHMYNGYHNHNHYNSHNHSGNHGNRNYHSHNYNGYYSNNHDAYSHTDTDSNSSASGHSDIGGGEHGTYNGSAHQSENHRPPRNSRRTKHSPSSKGSVNLEKVVHIITDSDGESSLPSINGHASDLSPEPSESCEISHAKKGEKDKVIRKLKKKLNEIHTLEAKKNTGVNMDCDQLKKLNRKKELEDELAALTVD